MVVGQLIFHSLKQRRCSKNLLAHLVHSSLHTGAIIFSKGLESDSPGSLPGSIELGNISLHLRHIAEAAPLPVGRDISAENAVPGLLESGELVAEEAPELRAGALEHGQAVD